MRLKREGHREVDIFKALHILSMFTAVTLLMGDALLLGLAVWRRDVRALAAILRVTGFRQTSVGAVFLLAGIAFGLLTVATGGLDFFAGWLVAAYVLVVALFVVNGSPWVQRIRKLGREAIEADAGQRPSDEVVHGMDSIRGGLAAAVAVNALLFVALILDMVLKPF